MHAPTCLPSSGRERMYDVTQRIENEDEEGGYGGC